MSDWSSAFTHAFRSLRRQPTFTLIALATLALGIGANTAIFSVIKTVVLNPLPYPAPERIMVLWEVSPEGNQDRVSIPTFEDWRTEARSLGSLAAYRHVDFSFSGRGDPRNVPGVRATPDLFTVLQANAMLGRTFTRDEAVVGADRVVVLSHGFWSRALGADPGVIGQAIRLDAVPVHRHRRDAARIRVPDQHQCRGMGAPRLRPQGHARAVAAGAVADGGRPPGGRRHGRARAGRDRRAGPAHRRRVCRQQQGLERTRRGRARATRRAPRARH